MSNQKNPRIRARRSYKPLWTFLGVLVAIAIILFTVFQLGIPQRTLAAIYVGDEKVTVAEWNYYYNQEKLTIAQSLGISPLHINLKDEPPFGDELGETWGELLENATRRRIQQTYVKKNEIEAIGQTFTDDDSLEVAGSMAMLRRNFADEGQFRTYLEQTYGIGVTPELVEKVETNNLMARKFDSNYRESLEFSDQEIQDFYDANPAEYQIVKYHLIQVDTKVDEDAEVQDQDIDEVATEAETAEEISEEVVEEANEETVDEEEKTEQERIDEMLKVFDEDLKKSKDFQAFAEEYEDLIVLQSAAVRGPAKENDPTYFERARDSIYPEVVRTWLFDEVREDNEVTRIDVEDTAYYVLFVERAADNTLTADISYRYFPTTHADNSQMTVHEIEQLKKIADEYAASITSAEDLEVGPEAEIIPTLDGLMEDEVDGETLDDAEVADDAETAEDVEATEDAEEVIEGEDAEDTEDEELGVPVVSYGPYHNEGVHASYPLLAEVTAAALRTDAGKTEVVVTFNGIYVIYVNERGPQKDWAASAEQDLSLERFNEQLTKWYEEDERYELREGSLAGFFTE